VPITLVIHGGAGTIEHGEENEEQISLAARKDLQRALDAGFQVLSSQGTCVEAVEAAIKVLEDSPQFNAGHGSVFTYDEQVELDASIMNGSDLSCGAVTGVKTTKQPISLARAVMEKSEHVFLSGSGADNFAESVGLEQVENSYFHTDHRLNDLRKLKQQSIESNSHKVALDHDGDGSKKDDHHFGTVGAAALDSFGNLAAGTSTGGLTNKRWGRVGDSPIIGAGTYADKNCAVSATGHGEFFIRHTVAYQIAARVKFGKQSFQQAAKDVVFTELLSGTEPGIGGVIGVDSSGRIIMPFNSSGMYRGWINESGSAVAIYGDDDDKINPIK
jgi:beta-aspartyl-peptidase (threonine type)